MASAEMYIWEFDVELDTEIDSHPRQRTVLVLARTFASANNGLTNYLYEQVAKRDTSHITRLACVRREVVDARTS